MAKEISDRYSIKNSKENWYKRAPYTFMWQKSDIEDDFVTFNLPISPQNLQIVTHFATNVIPTMYGTIEEHSEQRYFDITISGTTGMAPAYYEEAKLITQGPSSGRSSFKAANQIFGGAASSFFRKTRELLNRAKNELSEVLGDNSSTSIESGISKDATGYVAFHNFYLFLLKYKDAVSSGNKPNKKHPLSFINYKDNNAYDVSITHFSLTRDYRNPMLYNYSITMKAYNLRSAGATRGEAVNLSNFGLDGIRTSGFALVSNKARSAKNAAYAAIAAVRSAGL